MQAPSITGGLIVIAILAPSLDSLGQPPSLPAPCKCKFEEDWEGMFCGEWNLIFNWANNGGTCGDAVTAQCPVPISGCRVLGIVEFTNDGQHTVGLVINWAPPGTNTSTVWADPGEVEPISIDGRLSCDDYMSIMAYTPGVEPP